MTTGTTGGNEGTATQDDEPEIRRTIAGLFRRTPLIVACTLLTAGAALVFSLLQTKQYTADASLLFRDPGYDQRLFGGTSVYTDPQREAATNVSLISLDAVADRAAAALGGDMTGEQVSSEVDVQNEGQADVVSIQATDPDPEVAANVANAFAESYIVFRRNADRRKVQQARALVQADFAQLSPAAQQSNEGQQLQRQISRMATLEALQTGNAELVQRATAPASPSSPKTARNTILGLILGFLLGVCVALLLERLDRRIRQPKDFEEVLGVPVLTEVPENKSLARSNNGIGELLDIEGGAFQMLRARLRYFNVDREISSVLITSAAPGEGKTTVAWNLAASAAAAGLRTILVEADFHRASIARGTGTPSQPGLSELLSDQSPLDRTVQRLVKVEERRNGHELARNLDLIVAGSPPPNPVELLESEGMARLVQRLGADYELVVIDSPPLTVLADAIPLTKMVDGVIVVGQINKTTRDQAQALHAQLESLNAPVLGTVANRMPRRRMRYGYYTYGRSSSETA